MLKTAIVFDSPIGKSEQEYIDKLHKKCDLDIYHLHDLNLVKDVEKAEINESVFDHLLDLGDLLIDTESIRDILRADNTTWLFYHRFKLYFEVRAFILIEKELTLLSEKYKKVHLITKNQSLRSISNENLEVLCNRKKNMLEMGQLHYVFSALVRFFFGAFQSLQNFSKQILIIESDSHIQEVINEDLSKSRGNRFFHGYLKKVGNDHLILDHLAIQKDRSFRAKASLFRFKEPNARLSSEWVLGKYILNPFNWNKIYALIKGHRLKSGALKSGRSSDFDSIHKRMIELLIQNSMSSFYFNLKYEAYKAYFSRNKIKVVICVDENSPNNKAILDAAKFEGVYTIAYQHGSVHRLNPSYRFSENDIRYNPIPDLTLVWDKYWYDYLIEEANYPALNVKILGQLKKDIIPALLKSDLVLGKKQTYQSKKVILYASQPLRDAKLENQILKSVFRVCSEMDHVTLVVRPHPLEKPNKNIAVIAEKMAGLSYEVDSETDLFVALATADVVVTFFSTVGMEAGYFNKPLVIFDPLKQDPLHYIAKGVGIGTHDEAELKTAIENALKESDHSQIDDAEEGNQNLVDKLIAEVKGHL